MKPQSYDVRRFTAYRNDGHCFELYTVQTGECASFPNTKKALTIYAKELTAKGERP